MYIIVVEHHITIIYCFFLCGSVLEFYVSRERLIFNRIRHHHPPSTDMLVTYILHNIFMNLDGCIYPNPYLYNAHSDPTT